MDVRFVEAMELLLETGTATIEAIRQKKARMGHVWWLVILNINCFVKFTCWAGRNCEVHALLNKLAPIGSCPLAVALI